MKPTNCPVCPSTEMLIGRAATRNGKPIFPHYCCSCGAVTCQYASKAEVEAFKRERGEPKRVYTSTELRTQRGEEVEVRGSDIGPCVVCASTERVEIHHWAPYHLFGKEADKWPRSALCQPCHTRWHKLVTPDMGKQKGEWRKHAEAVRDARYGTPTLNPTTAKNALSKGSSDE